MKSGRDDILSGELLDEELRLTLAQLCRRCHVPEQQVIELVEEGVVEPHGRDPGEWSFTGVCVYRVRCVMRLERDLGVNRAGAALALELLDELAVLRARLARYGE